MTVIALVLGAMVGDQPFDDLGLAATRRRKVDLEHRHSEVEAMRAGVVAGSEQHDLLGARGLRRVVDEPVAGQDVGRQPLFDPVPEPLLAPPQERRWSVLWSSEDARYGGTGAPPPETEDGWRIPGESVVLMRPRRILDDP